MRRAASCTHPLQVRSGPRGARTGRGPEVFGSRLGGVCRSVDTRVISRTPIAADLEVGYSDGAPILPFSGDEVMGLELMTCSLHLAPVLESSTLTSASVVVKYYNK